VPANSVEHLIFFLQFVTSIFELGSITKHLMTGPRGNSQICFPSTADVPYVEGL